MTHFKKLLLAAACGSAFALPAQAETIALTSTGGGSFAGSFVQMVAGTGFDNFDFTPVSFAGLVSVDLLSLTGPIAFSVAALNDVGFALDAMAPTNSFSFSSTVTADAPLNLFVVAATPDFGTGMGSYRINVTATSVAAIPEPQTWALLALGLGAIGFAAQRRRGAPVVAATSEG